MTGGVSPEVTFGDPYAGLRDLGAECLACLGEALAYERARRTIEWGGPGVFDDISAFLDKLIVQLNMNNVSWAFRYQVLTPIIGTLDSQLLRPFETWGGGVLGNVSWNIQVLSNSISSALNHVPQSISNAINSMPVVLANALSGVLTGTLSNIRTALSPLSWLSAGLPSAISAPVVSVGSLIGGYLLTGNQSLATTLTTNLRGLIAGLASAPMSLIGPMAGVGTGLVAALAGLPANQRIFNRDLLNEQWTLVKADVGYKWDRIAPTMWATAQQAIETARPWFEQQVSNLTQLPAQYFDYLTTLCGNNLALQPSRALTSVGALYGMSIAAGAAAHVTSAALNLVPTLNWVGASSLAALVAEAAAFQPLTNASYGVLLNEVVAVPLRYHWNAQLRPRIPTEGEVFTMGRKHGITHAEFKQAMAYQGIPDWWIEKMYDFFWTDPSPMWLLRMVEGGIPRIENPGRKEEWLNEWMPGWRSDPLAWLRMKLMLAGYEDVDIGPMIEGMTSRGMASPVTQFKTSVRAMVRNCYWTETDASAALAPLGVRPEEVHLLVVAEELDYQKEYLDDQVMYYKESFRKGELGEQALELALSTIYVKGERIAQEVAREVIRALPKPKTTAEVAEPPEVKRLRTQAINSWTKRYRDWEISESDLLLGLTIIVQDPGLAQQMVAVELTRYREPPEPEKIPEVKEPPEVRSLRTQAINSWTKRYRDWEISEDDLLLAFTMIVQDSDLAEEMLEAERSRYREPPAEPLPPAEDPIVANARRQAIATWVTQYREGTITVDELELYLEPLISDEEVRSQLVALEELRYKPSGAAPPAEDPVVANARRQAIATWVTQYREGTITVDQLELYLEPLIPDKETRSQMVTLEQLRYNPAPELLAIAEENAELARIRAEHVRGHCGMFQKRLIDVGTLYTYLIADGLDERLARATAITQANKRIKVPAPDSLIYRDDVIALLAQAGAEGYEAAYLDGQITLETYAAWLQTIVQDPDVATYMSDVLALKRFATSSTPYATAYEGPTGPATSVSAI